MMYAHDSSSKVADVEDLPDVRLEASSPGPRVTFNIQDTVTPHCLHSNMLMFSSCSFIKVTNAFLVRDFQSISQTLPLTEACSTTTVLLIFALRAGSGSICPSQISTLNHIIYLNNVLLNEESIQIHKNKGSC